MTHICGKCNKEYTQKSSLTKHMKTCLKPKPQIELVIEESELEPIEEPETYINKIINEDSVTALKKLPSNSINLTITSPPYDDIRDYKGYNFNDTAANNIIAELLRVTKINSSHFSAKFSTALIVGG